ncbi:YigZ family protein [Pseudodesulfovibrio tunisiensis]|uniref:YigZ family protein n=1 Tax=Pseudodesulfovibrio tunisiensis TaxID=463192 RepID=UPI001FB1D58A|nr:YigZ family protein [Pseudodesulfovibrio tunisiensis]
MADRYLIPARSHRVEQTIKRSRFLATATHAPSADEARAFINAIKAEFPDATHNCWAFAAGAPGDTASVGMSDDGEPHGTAGRPMLNTLLHSDVGEIAVVVTRYFGGTKLGTGGLVRAYSGMVQAVLETLPTREKVETVTLLASMPYNAVTRFKLLLPDHEAEVLEETYGTDAEFLLSLPEERADGFRLALTELTDGRGTAEPV